jgi:hypothetical protein
MDAYDHVTFAKQILEHTEEPGYERAKVHVLLAIYDALMKIHEFLVCYDPPGN